MPKRSPSDPKVTSDRPKNGPKSPQNHRKMVLFCSRNGPKMVLYSPRYDQLSLGDVDAAAAVDNAQYRKTNGTRTEKSIFFRFWAEKSNFFDSGVKKTTIFFRFWVKNRFPAQIFDFFDLFHSFRFLSIFFWIFWTPPHPRGPLFRL